MLNNPGPDPRALKILKGYSELTQKYFANGCVDTNLVKYVNAKPTSPEEMKILVQAGLGFPVVSMSHDAAVEKCFSAFRPKHKDKFARLFTAGLGNARPDLRSGLPAFAMMKSMPVHRFQSNQAGFCEVCASLEKKSALDLTGLSRDRYFVGGLTLVPQPFEFQFFLSQHEALADETPSAQDIDLLVTVLNIARCAEQDYTAAKLQKLIKNITALKLDNQQARSLVETLGICGVLQTDKHRGYLERWTNPGLSPHKTHSSDWAYPVDFWTGKDGVNEKAVDFWFGSMLK